MRPSAPTLTAPESSARPAPGHVRDDYTVTEPTPTASANALDSNIDDADSLQVVVNKQRPLTPASLTPPDFVAADVPKANPAVLRAPAARALEQMFAAAREQGAGGMQVQSAYRAYATQVSVYDGWVRQLGREGADRQSARPGYSEHQTGLAVDISTLPSSCALQACFGDTSQGRWLAAHAWQFGFVLRYPDGLTHVTGYTYEPWHFRYIGIKAAERFHATGATTLEGFFALPAAPTYAP
jgi:zinc D-Ala-D-Ala carboxypeptidase